MERDGLKTMGDIGSLDDDGFLFIVDRKADMVICGGVNIYPAEIEATLLQGMPGLADCAVFGIPDPEFGEALAAAVQPAPARRWRRTRCAPSCAPAGRLQGAATVVAADELPREDTGKIFKRKLREPYWQGVDRRI